MTDEEACRLFARTMPGWRIEPVSAGGSYATDGRCHNAEPGTYGHECGKPATWLGTKASGFASGFCDRCKEHGHEARDVTRWEPRR